MHKKILALSICLLFFGGCASTVSVKVDNIEKSNLNNRSDDVPVTLVVYKLNNIEKFKESSDKDLTTREDGALGKDKIDSMRLQISPKSKIVAIKVNKKKVPYIGILTLFANNTNKTTKIWAKTKDASGFGFWSEKTLKFEITQEGIRQIQ